MRALDPAVVFLLILAIGIVAGVIYDRVAGPGWLTRQIAGSRRGLVTSALVGIAGSFMGFHIVALLALAPARGLVPLLGAAAGAALTLWGWRMLRR
jgi:uncharacterized membrane protein YeaQ/YmgE (transglycosylase-associated protein family)